MPKSMPRPIQKEDINQIRNIQKGILMILVAYMHTSSHPHIGRERIRPCLPFLF